MTLKKEKNNSILKVLTISSGMIFTIATFILALIYLNKINVTLQIAIVIFIGFIFCYLGAKLLVALSQTHDEKVDLKIKSDPLKTYHTKIASSENLCDVLIHDGFDIERAQVIFNENEQQIFHLYKITNNKGAYIDEFFIVNEPLFIKPNSLIDKKINEISANLLKKIKATMIKQRNIILCVFCEKANEIEISEFASKFNYTYSVILPVIINTKTNTVCHYEIPMDKPFAKGKALVNAQQMLYKHLKTE